MTASNHRGDSPTRVVRTRSERGRGVFVATGVVVHGDQRGRTLGFPTANIELPPSTAVSDGVWVAIVRLDDGSRHLAAVSIGRRPTYYGPTGVRLLEAFLLDFAAELYGMRLEVELHQRLRPQRRFRGPSDLVKQLEADVQSARAWGVAHGELVHIGAAGATRSRERSSGARSTAERRKSRRTVLDKMTELSGRRSRRELVITDAVSALLEEGGDDITHSKVADQTGLPEGYLRWAYPTASALRAAARRD
ncbi:riboflavin kinase [Microbacterium sp. A8/3-1]|uniref:riboflavin kinase n=1 Tax=Microbacterium sp. A8/3-1 TaxID=3160749 RepID=A0AAU7VXW7_9MICO